MRIFLWKGNNCKIYERAHDNCAILIFINNEISMEHTLAFTLHLYTGVISRIIFVLCSNNIIISTNKINSVCQVSSIIGRIKNKPLLFARITKYDNYINLPFTQ